MIIIAITRRTDLVTFVTFYNVTIVHCILSRLFYLMLYHAVPAPGTVLKLPETGTTVTYSTTTAESVAPNGTKVTLHGLDLWSEFHKSTCEMIITKAGRYSKCHMSLFLWVYS